MKRKPMKRKKRRVPPTTQDYIDALKPAVAEAQARYEAEREELVALLVEQVCRMIADGLITVVCERPR